MKRALIVVDHGSRVAAANALLERIASRLRERSEYASVIAAHMEIAEPDLAAAFKACVAAGANTVTVVPCFLASGSHVSEDIPRLVREAAAPFPDIAWSLGEPIGFDERLIEIVLDRAHNAERS